MQKMTLVAKSNMEVNMVEVSDAKASEEAIRQEEVNKTAFPKENEDLAKFLHRCQKKKSEVMLCPRCSSIFDKKVEEHIQGMQAVKAKWGNNAQPKMDPEERDDPRRGHQRGPMNQVRRPLTYRPPTNVPVGTWLNTMGKKRPSEEKWQTFDVPRGSSLDFIESGNLSRQLH